MIKNIFLIFILSVLFASCSSMGKINMDSEMEKAMFTGRIITEEGLPLEGVKIVLDKIFDARSDINGKFFFLTLHHGKHHITFEKEDYSKEEVKFEYNINIKKQYYMKVKLFSLNYLLSEGIELSKLKRYDDVEKLIKKLEEINPDDESVIYLKATFYYNKNMFNEAKILFENLVEQDRKNIYYHLPLINIYEKMQLYQKEAETCYYVGNNNPDDYLDLLKKSAEIYRDKLGDNQMYEKIISQYDNLSKKKE